MHPANSFIYRLTYYLGRERSWPFCLIGRNALSMFSQMEREGYFHQFPWARVQHPVSLLALPDGKAFWVVGVARPSYRLPGAESGVVLVEDEVRQQMMLRGNGRISES